jgi:hypothetical protein
MKLCPGRARTQEFIRDDSDNFGEAAEIILSTKGKSLASRQRQHASRVRSPDFIVAVYDRRGFLSGSAVTDPRYSKSERVKPRKACAEMRSLV